VSQYPSPYPPGPQPQYPLGYGYPTPAGDPRRPARRAAVLMWIISGLMIASGACCGVMGSVVSSQAAQLPPETRQQMEQLETQLRQLGRISFPALIIGAGVGLIVFAIGQAILAYFVRRGGMGAVLTALIVTGAICLFLLVFTILGAISSAANPQVAAGICVYIVPLALFILQFVWLIQAMRRAPEIGNQQAQYRAAYAQYEQNQQLYMQPPPGGYGYGYPAPPPPQQAPVPLPPQEPAPPPPQPPNQNEGT
jgi:hypothetical protein